MYNIENLEIVWKNKNYVAVSSHYFTYKKVFTVVLFIFDRPKYFSQFKPEKHYGFQYMIKPYGCPDGMSELFVSPFFKAKTIKGKNKKQKLENIKNFVVTQSLKKIEILKQRI